MFELKSVYFYFLALQISFIKLIKKIYFTTNIYKRSLETKIPQQFYFNPNPFLLTSITNYKNYSFKISEINPNIFWTNKKNINEEKSRHSFLWLNLIDRKNDGQSLQKIIDLWILKNNKFKKNIWESSVLSKRIISWILNVEIILKNGNFYFKKNFLHSIIMQTNHLKKNIKYEKDQSKRIEILTALIVSGLVFKEYEENFHIGIRELEKLVKSFYDQDGFPLTRNPDDLLYFVKYLILCKECIKDAQKYVPEFLDATIEKNLSCLKNVLSPNSQVPLFNGGKEVQIETFNKFLNQLEYGSKVKKNKVGDIFVFSFKKNSIFFDVGAPPRKDFSRSYQSGPLSFEYYLNGEKIITNCGFGSSISSKAELLSRLTSAQSTLTLNDTSVTKFERIRLINKIFGNSIKNTFKISNLHTSEDKQTTKFIASHNGYYKLFKCIHKRELTFDKLNESLIGCDKILKQKDGKPTNFSLRFHLYPGLNAIKTMSGNSILIQINKNKSLIFSTNETSVILEKGLFLARNKILNNTCITISGNLVNDSKTIHWEIKKKLS